MHEGKAAKQAEAQWLHGIMHGRCGRWMEGKSVRVPGEACVACPERDNHGRKAVLGTQKSAEAIVTER